MSETAAKTSKRNGWLLASVIRATAHATVSAFFDRIQEDGWSRSPEVTGEYLTRLGRDNPSTPSDGEIKYLFRMYDELVRLLDHFQARAGSSKRQRRRLRQELRLTSHLITRTLDRLQGRGVVPMGFPEVADFRLHEPVEVTPTHTLADDGRITAVYIHGFTSNGCVVRQARVAVLKYVPKPEPQPEKDN